MNSDNLPNDVKPGDKLEMVYFGYAATGTVLWNGTVYVLPATRTLSGCTYQLHRLMKRRDGRWGIRKADPLTR